MDSWSGYSIAAAILVIVAIIMIIAGIVMLENAVTPKTGDSGFSWPWLLIIGGVILLIIGIIVGYMGRAASPTATTMYSHTTAYGQGMPPGMHPGMYPPHPAYHPNSGMIPQYTGNIYYPTVM